MLHLTVLIRVAIRVEPSATNGTTAASSDPPAPDDDQIGDGNTTMMTDGGTATKLSPTRRYTADNDTPGEDGVDSSMAVNGTEGTGTPSTAKKDHKKRKSVPEHNKKTPKKKPGKELHLDVKPGEHWYVRTKGYPSWPSVICDEAMLPLTLLEKRPVSAASAAGIFRADFEAGGKNARDRRYPVMYLGTNELYVYTEPQLLLSVLICEQCLGCQHRSPAY
jgi:hypothetical protein